MSPPTSFQDPPPSIPSDDVADEARTWIAWLASDRVDEAGMDTFERWLAEPAHRRAFEHERVLWRSFGPKPSAAVSPRRGRSRRRFVALAAVAMLAAWFMAPSVALRVRADYRSGHAVESITLSDGSRAVLDADSAIAVHYDEGRRRVSLLEERAWFDVAPDARRRFSVDADGGIVEDISTIFTVAREPDHVEAVVAQGRVRVATNGDDWTYLAMGQGVRFGAGQAIQRLPDVPADRVGAWRQGELLLDDMDVASAIDRIGRYRPGRIIVRGDLSALPPVNAAFRIDQPERALDTLAASAGLSVTRLPFGIAIVGKAAR
ncbi:MAG: hypothetical protein GAK28_01241 [Luteibacter sp.]|uniref:FecR family protein n=1 Tax=Luteibacter sp. TaxID=1886636 RepID=UPI00137CD6D5|nr:FecR domain-containing protein [Luteibacter sp.]KAF1008261.1 MAG: hypothetical protein GAK28_01241 [Luteibacter sp.]